MKWIVTSVSATNILFAWGAFFFLPKNADVAFTLLFIALLGDLLDGFLARRWHVTSKVGTWLDSASDLPLYLLFPVRYWMTTNDLPLAVASVIVLAGVFRLIRFSLRGYLSTPTGLSYVGLPVYFLQILLAITILVPLPLSWLVGLLVLISLLMVSTLPIRKISVPTFLVGLVAYVFIYFLFA